MNLIKFSNGKWGIRKGWIFHRYMWFDDLDSDCWSGKNDKYFAKYCMTDELTAHVRFNVLKYGSQNKDNSITDEVIE